MKDQVAVLTGSTGGIGQAIARRLARDGVHLMLNARDATKLASQSEELRKCFPETKVAVTAADVGDAEQAQKVIAAATREMGRIDILINNAAVLGPRAPLAELSIEDIDRTIDTNLKGPLYLMKYALPGMVAREQGTIINVNSVAGKTALAFWSTYSAAKFGLGAVTAAVGEEHRSRHVRVISLYLGGVDTPIWDNVDWAGKPDRARMLSPQAVADAVALVLQQPREVYIRELTVTPTVISA
jgi:NADP-dependent 3-hydroxy acid dehydrogenase YdfG